MKNRKTIPLIVYLVVLAVAFTWISGIFTQSANTIPYSEVVSLFQKEQVKSFTVQGDAITLRLHTPYNGETTVSTALANPDLFREDMKQLYQEQADAGILLSYDFVSVETSSPYDLVLPLLIVGLVHTGITYCMYFSSLGDLPGQKAAILSYIDPLVAVLISVTVLGESMRPLQILGGALILGFTLWNELPGKKRM